MNSGSSTDFHYSKVSLKDNEEKLDKKEIPLKYGYGTRHVQLVIFFLCLVINYMARGHLGVTLVAMTSLQNDTTDVETVAFAEDNITNFNSTKAAVDFINEDYKVVVNDSLNGTITENVNAVVKPSDAKEEVEEWSVYKTYTWSKSIQDKILISFFVGYSLLMVPMALVCQRWGGKLTLQVSLLINGVVSLLTPWLTLWGGWQVVCACRALQGLSQSGVYPAIQILLARWVPVSEKATLASYVYTGATTGSVVGFQIGGLLSHSYGWPAAFWAIGLLSLLILTLLTLFGASSPQVHKNISDEEKKYILGHSCTPVIQTAQVPWKAIASSIPLWSTFATTTGSDLSFIFFFTQVPTYIHYIYGIDIKDNGLLSSLPYIVSIFASLAFGITSDYLTNNNIISVKNARRLSNTVSQVGMAASLIGSSYASTTTIAVFCFVAFMVSYMGIHTGWMLNQIDIAPNYSAITMAIGNMIAHLLSILMPFIISNIVVDVENVYQWRIMLYLEAAIAFVPNLIFVIFMSTDVQPWNEVRSVSEHDSETEIKSLTQEAVEGSLNDK